MNMTKYLYSPEGAGIALNMCRTRVYKAISLGLLDAVKDGSRTKITGESVERYAGSLPKASINLTLPVRREASAPTPAAAVDQPPRKRGRPRRTFSSNMELNTK
jgi:hypothetical protein